MLEAFLESKAVKRRWGAEQRLEFIEFRLFWEGGVNRSDLTSHFGVSVPQASNDLSDYKELAGSNLRYDASEKRYVATQDFKPLFLKPGASRYLNQLKAIADGIIDREETLIENMPEVDSMQIPRRHTDPKALRGLLEAIRQQASVEVRYQSMGADRTEPIWRRITPHAFGHDGFRWHVRAFCHLDGKFKDFIVSRCARVRDFGEAGAAADDDVHWQMFFDVVLRPNPSLSDSQQRTIALDYEMKNGRAELPIRYALLYYFEKRLRLDVAAQKDRPSETPVIVENWTEFVTARDAAMA